MKVVFLDIDGTLVDYNGNVLESTKKAILQAKKNGHKMVLCTGRSKFQIPKELRELGMDGVIAGAGVFVEAFDSATDEENVSNDSKITTKGTILCQMVIDAEHAKSAYDYLEGNGVLYCYQGEDGIVLNQRSFDGMHQIDRLNGMSDEMLENLHGVVHVTETPWLVPNLEKIIFYDAPFSLEKIKADLLPYFDTVALSLSGTEGVCGEIGRNNIHKATGIRLFLEHAGVAREDSIAIGDGPNDLQMMEYAGVGVAMGNAKEEVKKLADMVTSDVAEDGIYHAFEKLGLI
jgi:Cof subfamily protein (haloacid dehalogenase superfamily)